MRVFSTFSGISAATVAWEELGWSFAGYAEYDPHACAVLAARCGATAPRYHPTTDYGLMGDEMHALGQRISSGSPRVEGQGPAEWFEWPNYDKLFEMMEKEGAQRGRIQGSHSHAAFGGRPAPTKCRA